LKIGYYLTKLRGSTITVPFVGPPATPYVCDNNVCMKVQFSSVYS